MRLNGKTLKVDEDLVHLFNLTKLQLWEKVVEDWLRDAWLPANLSPHGLRAEFKKARPGWAVPPMHVFERIEMVR